MRVIDKITPKDIIKSCENVICHHFTSLGKIMTTENVAIKKIWLG